MTTSNLYSQSDVILRIHRPSAAEIKLLHPDQVVIGMLAPLLDPKAMAELAGLQVTAISLDAIPRTLSRSQAHGCAVVAGERGRLQGSPRRGRGIRAVLSRC